MKRQRGFTLIELLIVIAIIAVLISLLLPALQKAKWQAMTIKCSAQMKQIAQAAINYATDNNDSWPPYRGFRGYPIRINSYPTEYSWVNNAQMHSAAAMPPTVGGVYGIAGGAYSDPTEGLVMQSVANGNVLPGVLPTGPFPEYEPCNLGSLFHNGYMANLTAAFDPALPPDSPFSGGNAATNNWGNNTQYYSSYFFSPHAAYLPSIDDRLSGNVAGQMGVLQSLPANSEWTGANPVGPWTGFPILYNPYATFSSLPPDKCLAIDLINSYSNMAHTLGTKACNVNVVFGDAHVVTVVVPQQVIAFMIQITGNANLATIAASQSNTSGRANGATPVQVGAGYTAAAGVQWGIAAAKTFGTNSSQAALQAPGALGTQGVNQQPFLQGYIDLFEVLANQGNAQALNGTTVAPPATDLYWLYNGGQGRVTPYVPG